MMRLVIMGGGGHARAVTSLLQENEAWIVVGYIAQEAGAGCLDHPYLGGDEILPDLIKEGLTHAALGIGDNVKRSRLAAELKSIGLQCASIVSRHAIVSSSCSIGSGSIIMEGAIVKAEARLGDFAIVNTHATVEHDVSLGNGVHIAPGAVVTGSVQIGDRTLIGAGAVILPGIRIGNDCTIGAGSVVTRDVAAGSVCYGNPARLRPDVLGDGT